MVVVVAVAGPVLAVAKELVLVGIQLSRVPKQVARCIELTRTCHNQLRELVRLKEEHHAALTPDKLRQIDDTIVMGTKAFDEVCAIVGRFGPQAFSGVGLFSRLRWQYKDSREFEDMRHIIERNNIDINEAITRIIIIAELQPVTRMAIDYMEQREQQQERSAAAANGDEGFDRLLAGGPPPGANDVVARPLPHPRLPPTPKQISNYTHDRSESSMHQPLARAEAPAAAAPPSRPEAPMMPSPQPRYSAPPVARPGGGPEPCPPARPSPRHLAAGPTRHLAARPSLEDRVLRGQRSIILQPGPDDAVGLRALFGDAHHQRSASSPAVVGIQQPHRPAASPWGVGTQGAVNLLGAGGNSGLPPMATAPDTPPDTPRLGSVVLYGPSLSGSGTVYH